MLVGINADSISACMKYKSRPNMDRIAKSILPDSPWTPLLYLCMAFSNEGIGSEWAIFFNDVKPSTYVP